MLKKVLSMVARGNHTISSISSELGIEKGRTLDMIEQLSRMGYIIDQTQLSDCSPTACKGCPLRKACGDGSKVKNGLNLYMLTEKGRRVLR